MNTSENCNESSLGSNIDKTQYQSAGKTKNISKATSVEMKALSTMLNKGQLAESKKLAIRMTQRYPRDDFGWKVLGAVNQQQGLLADAEYSYKMALEINSNNALINFNLGIMLGGQSRLEEAQSYYKQAINIQPDLVAAQVNLGSIFHSIGKSQEAAICYRKALKINPNHVVANSNLGIILLETGDFSDAEVYCKKAIEIDSNYADAYNNLGLILSRMGRFTEAESAYDKALVCNPDHTSVPTNLSGTLIAQGKLVKAECCLKIALNNAPDDANLYINLGMVYMLSGNLQKAEESFLQSLRIKPDSTMAQSNLMFAMSYSDHTVDDCIKQARQYGRMAAAKVDEVFTTWLIDPKSNRIRVGFMSGDFRQHAVTYFLENLLQHIDPSHIELIAYPVDGAEDDVTTRLKPHFSAWRPLLGLNDQAAAKLIHDDGIHILLDLSGHTAFSRLPVFAWKPAPVQASWLGYWATTGVNEMDYFISDAVSVPEFNKVQFTEQIKYLPDTRLCFTVPNVDINVSSLPALVNGCITFGCFQNMTKVGDGVLRLWSQVMNALPNARLRWQCQPLVDLVVAEALMQRLVHCGISSDRVTLLGSVSREAYLAAHVEIDMILDSFPFTGGTTTCEALWMGVPTLSLAGNSLIARQGASLLTAAGLADWVVESEEEYVSKAILFASDLEKLVNLRARLREQVLASPLFDAPRFAKNMEIALWEMWYDSQINQTKQDPLQNKKQLLVNPPNDKTSQSQKLNVQIVCATRYSEVDFWSKSALGLSLKRHLKQSAKLSVNIAFENSLGLSEVFNRSIDQADDDAILVFIHDDVWIDEANFVDTVIVGLENFDVIGVSGNRRRLPNQPAWAFIDAQLTWDDKLNLSGRMAHGKSAFGKVSDYGAVPAECELLGDVFLATKKSSLIQNKVRFDTQFDYHFYEMDFCRSARKSGLKLGTWLVHLTHQNSGAFGSKRWKEMYQLYLNKWEAFSANDEVSFSQHNNIERENNLQQAMNEVLQIALEHQNSGQMDQAESLYLEIINIQPKHADANHNLGVIEASYKGAIAALPRFEIALQEKPENEQFWVTYIDALMQSGAFDTAVSALEAGKKYGLKSETAQMLAAEYVAALESKME